MKKSLTILTSILTIITVPVAILLYFSLFWFWGGDGRFTLIATPICFLVYLGGSLFGLYKCKHKKLLHRILMFVIILILPLLTMYTVMGLADIFGIVIDIA